MDACVEHSFDYWDLPFAYEGLARALVANDPVQAEKHLTEAKQLGEKIEKTEDKEWLHTNLDEITAMINAT
jgi:hypothetical protein